MEDSELDLADGGANLPHSRDWGFDDLRWDERKRGNVEYV